jgi:hypothetical protein
MTENLLAIALLFGGGTLFLLAISPIGRAVAERIRRGGGQGPAAESGSQEALQGEIRDLRLELGELAERVDFMERLQARPRDAGRLAPPG